MLNNVMPVVATAITFWMLRSLVGASLQVARNVVRIRRLETKVERLELENARLHRQLNRGGDAR
jgi:hypothetical protein